MQDLRYCLREAEEAGVHKHPQIILRELGIKYVHATPQSMVDQWWFWGCTWDAELLGDLPGFLSPLDLNPSECVGFGLSQEDAEAIVKAKAALHLQDAAPDLLEATKQALAWFLDHAGTPWDHDEAIIRAQQKDAAVCSLQSAIAKAKGETK